MRRWAYTTFLLLACAACGKSQAGTEFGNPPVIAPDLVSVQRLTSETVVVTGAPGAVNPGNGEVTVTNLTSGKSVTTVVDEDGSFRAELPGTLEDEYDIVASNDNGSSPTHTLVATTAQQPVEPSDAMADVEPVAQPATAVEHDWHILHPCDDDDPVDAAFVTASSVEGDLLNIDVLHGCGPREFGLCYRVGYGLSDPAVQELQLLHDAHGDQCDALITTSLSFDLSALQAEYEKWFAQDSGLLRLTIDNCDAEPGDDDVCRVVYGWGEPDPLRFLTTSDRERGLAHVSFFYTDVWDYSYIDCSRETVEVLKPDGDGWTRLLDERPNSAHYLDGTYVPARFPSSCDALACVPVEDRDVTLFEYVQTGTMPPPPDSEPPAELPDEVPVIERRVPDSLRLRVKYYYGDSCAGEPQTFETSL